MKLSDVVFLKPGQTTSDEGGTLPADADLFSLSERRFQSLPERVAIVDGDSLGAVVEKELLSFLRRRCSANQLLAMLENAPIGVVAIDNDSRIFYANFAYTRILGVPKQRVLGQYMRVLEPEAEILKVLNGSESVIDRTVWITSVKRHVRVNIAPIALNGRAWGAVSFFTDVTESTRLAGELSRAKNLADHFQRELETQAELPQGFDDIIGRNSRFVKVLQTAGIVAKTDAPVLIQGEHGVGKEVLARAVHRASPRATRPFISVNCAAVPETLLESELFGYEDGAFTGARRGGRMGRFELADGGVLFLDEIGDMPASMQAKLLRVLQEKEIEKIGRKKTIKVDVRIIAATNRNLEVMVGEGGFRADLYYRLNVVSLTIPPLRERIDDIPYLAEDMLEKYNKKYGKDVALSFPLREALHHHGWPGNVRELANILEHAVIMCSGPLLLPEHLPAKFLRPSARKDSETGEPLAPLIPGKGWQEAIGRTETRLLRQALTEAGGNRSEAIRLLGISRKAFYSKLKRYGLL